MKRIAALFLTLALLLALSACKEEVEEADTSLDSDRGFLHYGGMEEVCATEDTVYFARRDLVYYYDKASSISGILCGKPECEHSTASGSSCNAYINSSSENLQIYNSRLYWISGDAHHTIYSMALDGTDRRTERQLKSGEVYTSHYGLTSAVFHRGYAYIWVINYKIQDGREAKCIDLAAVPLDPNEEVCMIFSEELDTYAASWNPWLAIQAYGDDVYILMDLPVGSSDGGPDSYPDIYDFRIQRYDTQTQELATLYHDGQSPIWYPMEMWAMDDGLLFFCHEFRTAGDTADIICRFDYDSGELTRVFEPVPGAVGLVDGMVVSNRSSYEKSNPTNPWGLTLAPQDIERTVEFYVCLQNFSGDVLWEDTYRLEGYYSMPDFCGVDDTYAYFLDGDSFGTLNDNTSYFSLIGVALDGSGMEVLCSEEEYYEFPGTNRHSTSTRTLDDGTTIVVKDDKIITVTAPDGEAVTMTVEELLENGWQP